MKFVDSQSSSSSLKVICFSSLARRTMIFLRIGDRPSRPIRIVEPKAEHLRARREAIGDHKDGDKRLFLFLWMSLTMSTEERVSSSRVGNGEPVESSLSACLQVLVMNFRQAPLSDVLRTWFLTIRVIFVGFSCACSLVSTIIGMWSIAKKPSVVNEQEGMFFSFHTK